MNPMIVIKWGIILMLTVVIDMRRMIPYIVSNLADSRLCEKMWKWDASKTIDIITLISFILSMGIAAILVHIVILVLF